jgi:hypothetical protein
MATSPTLHGALQDARDHIKEAAELLQEMDAAPVLQKHNDALVSLTVAIDAMDRRFRIRHEGSAGEAH